MANTQAPITKQQGDGTRELRILVGVLVAIMFGVILAAWAEAQPKPTARAVAPAPTGAVTPTGTERAVTTDTERAVSTTGADVIHADVYFDSTSARLRADAMKVLQEKTTLMDLGGTWEVVVEGHADRYGTPEYNLDLSKRRAEEVKQFLVELGVPETAVTVVAVGQDGSVCDGPSRQCQKQNRRVHIEMRKVSGGAASAAVEK